MFRIISSMTYYCSFQYKRTIVFKISSILSSDMFLLHYQTYVSHYLLTQIQSFQIFLISALNFHICFFS